VKIAVVGAGIFGVTIALKIDQMSSDYCVTLFESSSDIFTAASRTNQLRLHRGYHYPRSPETTASLLESIDFFMDEYKDSVINKFDHYYCISKEKSLVTPKQYLSFCDRFGLEYETVDNFSHVDNEKISLTIKVKESLLDYHSVYNTCWRRLRNSDVSLRLNTAFSRDQLDDFDLIINCTYANINEVLLEQHRRNYQFEICEKIIVQMPNDLVNKSIVIMDGPFMCVDPYGKTELSLLGNVVHAIHHANSGIMPKIPSSMMRDLNQGVVKKPFKTNFDKFVEHGKQYIPSLEDCLYEGSMFTVRAVLPNMDDTDGRPTVITYPDNKIINVFSGKIDTCAMVARKIVKQLHKA